MTRVIAVASETLTNFQEKSRKAIHIAPQQVPQHLVLLCSNQGRIIAGFSGKRNVQVGERCLTCGVDKETANTVQEVISGCPSDRPFRW